MKHIFISAELSTLSPNENAIRTESLREILATFPHVQVKGSYEGNEETSFRVQSDNVGFFMRLAANFGQHSIMIVNGDQAGLLYIQSRQWESLGTLTKVDSTQGLTAFSVIPGEGIFTVK